MALAACLHRVRRCRPGLTRVGQCPVCGRRTAFLIEDPAHIRENAWCLWCGSSSRNRHLAKCVLDALSLPTVMSFRRLAAASLLDIYLLSAYGPLAEVLRRYLRTTCSEYFDDVPSGEFWDGIRCEDVQQLSFDDSSFDLVISEDVFEHVRDYRKGFEEIRRVLRPGGHHIFSVPLGISHPTLSRYPTEHGADVPVLPEERHGDPIRGSIAVHTSFGHDSVSILQGLGFEARLETARPDDCRRFGAFDSATFVTRKP
jgi:SAM-dependent methyltransferase